MAADEDGTVTDLLVAWRDGDTGAAERLMTLVYRELHRLAHRYMKQERPGHALQTSALVHETYLRLVDIERVQWADRTHFFAMAGRLMRRILVDFARRRQSLKRGGRAEHVDLDEALTVSSGRSIDLVALDEALDELAARDPRKAKVVELRFFAGLPTDETATVLDVSPETVRRDWRLARAWLKKAINRPNRVHQ